VSRRPIEAKQRRKVAKAFRATPPAYFDLVQWLVEHKYAPTKRLARELILAKRVRKDSHVLGIATRQTLGPDFKLVDEPYVHPFVRTSDRVGISVLPADA